MHLHQVVLILISWDINFPCTPFSQYLQKRPLKNENPLFVILPGMLALPCSIMKHFCCDWTTHHDPNSLKFGLQWKGTKRLPETNNAHLVNPDPPSSFSIVHYILCYAVVEAKILCARQGLRSRFDVCNTVLTMLHWSHGWIIHIFHTSSIIPP